MIFSTCNSATAQAANRFNPQRRRDHPQCQIGHDNLAEVDRIDAIAERDGRRDQYAKFCGRGLNGSGQWFGVAMFDHRGDQNGPDGECGCHRRAGDRCEQHTCQNAGAGQTALHTTHQRLRQLDQTLRDAARRHQITSQNKQRDRHDGKAVDSGKHALGNQQQWQAALRLNPDDRSQTDRDRNGHTENKKDGEG